MLHTKVQKGLGIFVIHLHHVVDIVLHGVGASPLMEHGIYVGAVEIVVLYALEEIVLMLIVNELQPPEILIVLSVLQVIHYQYIRPLSEVQFPNYITADEPGASRYDYHIPYILLFIQLSCTYSFRIPLEVPLRAVRTFSATQPHEPSPFPR